MSTKVVFCARGHIARIYPSGTPMDNPAEVVCICDEKTLRLVSDWEEGNEIVPLEPVRMEPALIEIKGMATEIEVPIFDVSKLFPRA